MTIKLNEKENTGKFFIGNQDDPKAEIAFKKEQGDVIVAKHTKVSDELKGEGVGRKLLDKLVKKARNENKKIKAECSYVQHVFEKYNEYNDVQQNT